MDSIRHTLALPDGCPDATAGVVLPGGREAAIGLTNGDVYKWNMRGSGSYEKMFEGYSRISAIDMRDGVLLVSARDGPLVTIDADTYGTETLRQWSQHQSSRIWKCAWLDDGRAVMTSTYGGIDIYKRRGGSGGSAWDRSPLHGHVHSVLAVGTREDLLATGDWTGKVVIWRRRGGSYSALASMRGMSGAVRALAWVDGRTLAGIDENGLVRQFEADPASGEWMARYELDVVVGQGTSLHIAGDKKTLLAGTDVEVVQVDLETMRHRVFPLEGAVGIGSEGDVAYVVARNGVHTLPIGAIEGAPGTAVQEHQGKSGRAHGRGQVHALQGDGADGGRRAAKGRGDPAGVRAVRLAAGDRGRPRGGRASGRAARLRRAGIRPFRIPPGVRGLGYGACAVQAD